MGGPTRDIHDYSQYCPNMVPFIVPLYWGTFLFRAVGRKLLDKWLLDILKCKGRIEGTSEKHTRL